MSAQVAVTLADIRRVARQIGEKFQPQRVWLFGSYAYGTPTVDSDVDLLVTMDTQLRGAEQAALIREAVDFPFPTDLLVRTPRQFNDRLALGDLFFEEIARKGIVLYEGNHAGVG